MQIQAELEIKFVGKDGSAIFASTRSLHPPDFVLGCSFGKDTHLWCPTPDKERGVTLHLFDCNVDTSTPIGELFLRILGCFADYERSLAAERTRAALRIRKAEGKPVNQYVGYGFRLVAIPLVKL